MLTGCKVRRSFDLSYLKFHLHGEYGFFLNFDLILAISHYINTIGLCLPHSAIR